MSTSKQDYIGLVGRVSDLEEDVAKLQDLVRGLINELLTATSALADLLEQEEGL